MHIPWSEPENYLNIDWNTGNNLPTPHVEISQAAFDRFLHCSPFSLRGINYRQVKVAGWSMIVPAHFYLFGRIALAVTTAYCPANSKKLKGVLLPATPDGKWGNQYRLRFWRLGCQHPNLETTTEAMFQHRQTCPDCGWSATYDSSG